MNFDEYISNVKKTESIIEVVDNDKRIPILVLEVLATLGDFIDLYKKKSYYNKDIPTNDIIHQINRTIVKLEQLKRLFDYHVTKDTTLLQGIQNDVDEVTRTRLFHMLLGIISEGGEIASNLIATGGDDRINLLEEIGDILWYLAIGIDDLDGDFDKILQTNINKLKTRYSKHQFTSTEANNRNVKTERQVLEQGLQ